MVKYNNWTENEWKSKEKTVRKPGELLVMTTFTDYSKFWLIGSKIFFKNGV